MNPISNFEKHLNSGHRNKVTTVEYIETRTAVRNLEVGGKAAQSPENTNSPMHV